MAWPLRVTDRPVARMYWWCFRLADHEHQPEPGDVDADLRIAVARIVS